MSEVVLKAENISKQYRLGQVGTGTLTHDLNRWWHKVRGKEDPYLKVGEANDRSVVGSSEYVWSLKDINFEVKQGEVLGIIGKNGAGKSTLLKILSQVTTPTTGQVKIKGRIAALLEVGTGFHPDLSGRENVFLNGAILGMTKAEIKSKLDEIVDFSGVAKYLDTPVKRYSSGMMVRLGFAVAAHLEPEILIVDEVLAVGDAEFQKKCLGKMKDVSGQGRTVLFVSHNMPSIQNLCTRAVLLETGRVKLNGSVSSVISGYLGNMNPLYSWIAEKITGNKSFNVTMIDIVDNNKIGLSDLFISKDFYIRIHYKVEIEGSVGFSLVLFDQEGNCLFGSLNNNEEEYYGTKMAKGEYISTVKINGNLLNNLSYNINLIGFSSNWTDSFIIENVLRFKCLDDGELKNDYSGNFGGVFRPKLEWHTKKR